MANWYKNAIFYHIYPLGFCGAPQSNDFNALPINRLQEIIPWLDHMQTLGVNALYLGPLFESTTHGYDTANYYEVDRRLGTSENFLALSDALHSRGISLVLDAVFNHVGRDFWAFKDVLANGEASPYKDWFYNLRFDESSPFGDPFAYDSWDGHYSLVKLNLENPQVKQHLFGAVEMWMRDFNIDGLRLDAADCLSFSFLQALSTFCHDIRPDFWLMGEVIHGDYRQWVNPETLDSVTNYELYKGLFSSHNEKNYFELAYSLNRQFGPQGIYRDLLLYTFADNHDVNRIASQLTSQADLYPLYILLFTMPGIPSIYYGSEFGIPGEKHNGSDHALRPKLDLNTLLQSAPQSDLVHIIAQLTHIRCTSPELQSGNYIQRHVDHQQFAFTRQAQGEFMLVAVNASDEKVNLNIHLAEYDQAWLTDLLNPSEQFPLTDGNCTITLNPSWGRILRVTQA